MSDEFGPVDLTGVKPDKLSRLIDIPGVKKLIEAAYITGMRFALKDYFDDADRMAYENGMVEGYMKALEAKDDR